MKQRKYKTSKKTSTKEGKKDYMRQYMPDYRKRERELLTKAKKQFGWGKHK